MSRHVDHNNITDNISVNTHSHTHVQVYIHIQINRQFIYLLVTIFNINVDMYVMQFCPFLYELCKNVYLLFIYIFKILYI